MARINCVAVTELSGKHLVAEYGPHTDKEDVK